MNVGKKELIIYLRFTIELDFFSQITIHNQIHNHFKREKKDLILLNILFVSQEQDWIANHLIILKK